MSITCSTKVCSFGKQVVEKVETEYARFENGRFIFRIHRSPMCEYMINFIHKLKHLPEKYMMNSVLENFTILQVRSSFIWLLFHQPFGVSDRRPAGFMCPTGGYQPRDPRDFTLYRVRLWSIHVGTRRAAPHVQAGQRLRWCVPMNIYIILYIHLLYELSEVSWSVLFGCFSHTHASSSRVNNTTTFPNEERVPPLSIPAPAQSIVLFCLWLHPIPKYPL